MIGKSMDKLLFKGKRGQLCAPLFIFLPHMGRNVPIVLPTPTITNCDLQSAAFPAEADRT
jgi:hypothetical protein